MSKQYNVIVAGGGIVGLISALAMAVRGYHVALIDSKGLTAEIGTDNERIYAINRASQTLLTTLGVWQLIPSHLSSPYQKMHVWDGSNQAVIDFDARMIAADRLGTILSETVLKNSILHQISKQNTIDCFPFHTIKHVKQLEKSISVNSEDCSWTASLLIVADGATSPLRGLLKVPISTYSYHQHALVARVATEKPHQKTAYQIFNPDGRLAFLPLSHGNHSSIVWSTTPAKARYLSTLDPKEFNQALSKAFDNHLGEACLLGERHTFPLSMRHVKQYVGQNWLLMGDAAHTLHPLAGLGLNIGIADVTTWLACLEKAQLTFSKTALAAYQRKRKAAVWPSIALMEVLKTTFSTSFLPAITLRGIGLNCCNHLYPLKRLLIEHAQG